MKCMIQLRTPKRHYNFIGTIKGSPCVDPTRLKELWMIYTALATKMIGQSALKRFQLHRSPFFYYLNWFFEHAKWNHSQTNSQERYKQLSFIAEPAGTWPVPTPTEYRRLSSAPPEIGPGSARQPDLILIQNLHFFFLYVSASVIPTPSKNILPTT